MRISDVTRFPHPVLGPDSLDFVEGQFDLTITVKEQQSTGAIILEHEATVTQPSIRDLVTSDKAGIGLFVRCDDTYHAELRPVTWPAGRTDFVPGSLINRVTVRPLIWLKEDLSDWNPDGVHPEFTPPLSMRIGDVIAIGPEQMFNVGQAKLAPLETIFELRRMELPEPRGAIRIDLDADRILILAESQIFDAISVLRQQRSGLDVILNGVYLPAVMEVLENLRSGTTDYSSHRWYTPFTAKCDAKGIDPNTFSSLIEAAQILLNLPATRLSSTLADSGSEAS